MKPSVKIAIVLCITLLFVAGCQADPALLARLDTLAENTGGMQLTPSDVTFNLSVIEVKGATDGIPAPEVNPLELSSGYRFTAPGDYDADNPDKWQVSTYMFTPASLTVAQGDDVTLRTFVVNGDHHTVWLDAPDGSTAVDAFMMERGREYHLEFTAEQSGYYILHCGNHAPTMSANILVLPTGG